MAANKGSALYDHLLDLMQKLEDVFAEVTRVVDELAQPVSYPVAPGLKGKVKTERVILSAQSSSQVRRLVQDCKEALRPLRGPFQARRNAGVYPLQGLFDDLMGGNALLNLVNCIIGLLDIDPVQLTGPLPDLIVSVALDQLELFDDTVRTPSKHLAGTGFENRVVQVDVTTADEYQSTDACRPYRARYPGFIQRLERLEAAYARNHEKRDLTDILLTIAAQEETVRAAVKRYSGYDLVDKVKDYEFGQWLASHAPDHQTTLDYARGWFGALAWIDSQLAWIGDRSQILDTLARLAKTVFCLYSVLHSRDVGGLAVPKNVAAFGGIEDPEIGSLSWLMRVSHSVSRHTLHPDVEQALRAQITSLKAAQK